ncbi:MAG: type II secretion system protein [Gemmatimonadaceae bacterium]
MPTTRDRRGMTLVEVMVSALVLGVMAVAVLSSSTLLAKMSREASDQLAQVQGSRSGLDNNDITAFDSLAVGTYSQSVDARGIATTGGAYTRTIIVDQPAGGAKRIRVLMSKN